MTLAQVQEAVSAARQHFRTALDQPDGAKQSYATAGRVACAHTRRRLKVRPLEVRHSAHGTGLLVGVTVLAAGVFDQGGRQLSVDVFDLEEAS